MDHRLPTDPPHAAPEREMLGAFLDYYRAVVVGKLDGLTREQTLATPTASSLSLLAIVRHLAWVEDWWFQQAFAGREVDDPNDDFTVGDGETVESVAAFYEAQCAKSRAIAAGASLDDTCRHPEAAGRSLRWILVHMIEEIARHAGHADLIREAIDGRTGD